MENKEPNIQILSQTNRKFYSKKKKGFQLQFNTTAKVQKTLKVLLNKQLGCRKVEHCRTEKSQQKNQRCLIEYEQNEMREKIVNILKTGNSQFKQLYKMFEKLISSTSKQAFQTYQMQYYRIFYELIDKQDKNMKALNSKKENKKNQRIKTQNRVYMQNVKLQKENNLLRNQLSQTFRAKNQNKQTNDILKILLNLQTNNQDTNKAQTYEEQQQEKHYLKRIQRNMEMKTQQCQILRKEIQMLKEDLYLLHQQKKQLHERIFELKSKNENLCSEIVTFQMCQGKSFTPTQLNELSCMQKQQILSYEFQMKSLRKIYVNLSRKYKNLVGKMKKITSTGNDKMLGVSRKCQENFQEQMYAFQSLKNKHNQDNLLKNRLSILDQRKKEKNMLYQSFFGEKQTLNNREGIKKSTNNISYFLKPSFYCLIFEELKYFGIDETNYEHININIKFTFLSTVRGIMDSKYNEFVYHSQGKNITSFPVFVFSWLNTYHITNKKKKQIRQPNEQAQRDLIPNFYANLMSEKLNCFWQIVTFRQFLMQTLGIDELYYYLELRMYLLKGDMLNTLDSFFEEMYYIEYEKGHELIEKFIHEKDNDYRKNLEEFFRRSAVYVRKKCYLDIHYILRLMVEYYQFCKKREIQSIVKTIQIVSQHQIMNINFMDFLKIFDYHFSYLSISERTQLFVKCFNVGNGKISIQIILSVFHEQKLFLNFVDKVHLGQQIRMQNNKMGNNEILISPHLQQLYEIERMYCVLHRILSNTQLNSLGIQSISNRLSKTLRLDTFTIHERLQEYFKVCMYCSKKLFRTGNINILGLMKSMTELTQFMQVFSKSTIQKCEILETMQLLKYQSASQKIIRFYKKKKNDMDRGLVYAYGQKVIKEDEKNKVQSLRNQFQNIIEEIKAKKTRTIKFIE